MTLSPSQKIQQSLLKLAAQKPMEEIDLGSIANGAGVTVGDITSLYSSRHDIVWDYVARLDEACVSTDEFSEQDSIHDKLFDLLMKRLESLKEDKAALKNILAGIEKNDLRSLYVNPHIVRAMGWVLECAGVGTTGLDGEARKRGLAWVFGTSLDAFLEDDDPGLSKTMMVLDRSLSRVVVWQERFGSVVKFAKGAGSLLGGVIDNLQKRASSPKPADPADKKPEGSKQKASIPDSGTGE